MVKPIETLPDIDMKESQTSHSELVSLSCHLSSDVCPVRLNGWSHALVSQHKQCHLAVYVRKWDVGNLLSQKQGSCKTDYSKLIEVTQLPFCYATPLGSPHWFRVDIRALLHADDAEKSLNRSDRLGLSSLSVNW